MSDKNDGGPAFPHSFESADNHPRWFQSSGMSIRDWFASKADVPWNAVIGTLALLGEDNPTIARIVEYRAHVKYAEADAMLKAREA